MGMRQLSRHGRWVGCSQAAQRGAALITSLVLIAVLTLLGTSAIMMSIVDTKIGGNYKTGAQAFYTAEAGLEEARGRLRTSAAEHHIMYTSTAPQWKAYIASGAKPQAAARQRAQTLGYNATHHSLFYSLQSALDYTVVIEPVAGNANHLRLTSYGSVSGAEKTLQVVVKQPPAFTAPAALYVEAQTVIQGFTTDITGMDHCGSDNKPGLLTPLPPTAVSPVQGPSITGTPDFVYNGANLDLPAMVNTFKPYANFTYTVSDATHTATTTPGPGDNWGQPTLGTTPQHPSSCNVYNVVHYNTAGTAIQLHNGVSGCGILLVEGDLKLQRGFSWYGLVLVTGTVAFDTPELQRKQITGAVLSGGISGQNDIGFDSHIVYCSAAVNTRNLPLRVLNWKELYTALPPWEIPAL